MNDRHAIRRPGAARDRLEYRLVVTLAFTFCLALAVARRLLGHGKSSGPYSRAGGESLFAEARSSAHAAVGYAYLA